MHVYVYVCVCVNVCMCVRYVCVYRTASAATCTCSYEERQEKIKKRVRKTLRRYINQSINQSIASLPKSSVPFSCPLLSISERINNIGAFRTLRSVRQKKYNLAHLEIPVHAENYLRRFENREKGYGFSWV